MIVDSLQKSFFLSPKDVKSLVILPGMHTDHTLLNVVRSRGPGRIRDAVVIDNLETKPDSIISKGIVGQVILPNVKLYYCTIQLLNVIELSDVIL